MNDHTTTQRFIGSIRRGRGAPWKWMTLTDVDGVETTAMCLGPSERHTDGHFYSYQWGDTRLRLVYPPWRLPSHYAFERTRLMGKTIDGRWVGPFTIAPDIQPSFDLNSEDCRAAS